MKPATASPTMTENTAMIFIPKGRGFSTPLIMAREKIHSVTSRKPQPLNDSCALDHDQSALEILAEDEVRNGVVMVTKITARRSTLTGIVGLDGFARQTFEFKRACCTLSGLYIHRYPLKQISCLEGNQIALFQPSKLKCLRDR